MVEKGDMVSVIDQNLDGIVLSVTGSGNVTVRCKDGMDWEFTPNELVVTKAANPKKEPPKPISKPAPKPKPKPSIVAEPVEFLPLICLAFIKNGKDTWDLKLCNRSGYHIIATVSQNSPTGWENIFSGKLLNSHDADLAHYRSGDLNDIGSYLVQAVYFKIAAYNKKEPLSCEIKVRPKKFLNSENFRSYQGLANDAMILELKYEEPLRIPQLSINQPRKVANKPKTLDHSRFEGHSKIDLHIEMLVSDLDRMSPGEMLEIQKQACIEALNSALADPHKLYVTIVHGHGKGTLKREVIKILNEYGLSFNQDLYLRTGQAAIEVQLK